MKPVKWTAYFPVYINDWKRVAEVANPEQLMQILSMCLNYAQGRPVESSNDPFVTDCFNIIIEKAERRAEGRSTDEY